MCTIQVTVFQPRLNLFGQHQPMEENITLINSDDAFDKTAAENVRPSSERRQTTPRSGPIVGSVIGPALGRVVGIYAPMSSSGADVPKMAASHFKKTGRMIMLLKGAHVRD